MATVSEVFNLAWQNHQTGNYSRAEQLYRQILQHDPRHADAWCFLGAACQAQGRVAEAETNFRQAVRLLPGHPSAQNCLGILLAEQGKFDEAAALFQQLISQRSTDAEACNNLGLVRARQGRLDEAITCYQRALQLRGDFMAARTNLDLALQSRNSKPRPPSPTVMPVSSTMTDRVLAANQRGVALAQQGRFDEAVACMQQALQLQPDSADTLNNYGIILDLQEKRADAINVYHQALRINPNLVAAHYNLAIAFQRSGNMPQAAESFLNALRLMPDYIDAHNNVSIVFMELEKLDEAAFHCREALRLDSKHAGAFTNLGNVFQRRQQLDEAKHCYEEALRCNPNFAEAYNNLAKTYQDQRKMSEAIDNYEHALRLNPNFSEAHYNLGNALRDTGRLEDAVEKYRLTIKLKPQFPFAHNNLGDALLKQGRPDLAIGSFREALRLDPNVGTAQSNLLFCLNYDPLAKPDDVFEEHRKWGRRYETFPLPADIQRFNVLDPERRLRIGYISPDFRYHPLTRYFEPILAHHDPVKVETFCYSEVPFSDSVTKRLQELSHHWFTTCHRKDAEIAKRIYDDRIDILVDLAGHTANNRLAVFAYKPAPIQATWLGYMNTTGLTRVDYRLTDDILDPPGQPVRDTEELWRLPSGMCCFLPPAEAPAVAPLPALERGHLTFGALHNLFKLNNAVFDLWSRLLIALPTAKLLVYRDTMTATAKEHIRRQFAERGIGEERLETRHGISKPGYLTVFEEIDVVLDAFPCTGGVTTCEAMWMGVPVLTLSGARPANRNSAALLTRAGLSDWVTETPDQYLARALRIPNELEQMAELRAGLRERMSATLCDAKAFTPRLEEAYRAMWRRWCSAQPSGKSAP